MWDLRIEHEYLYLDLDVGLKSHILWKLSVTWKYVVYWHRVDYMADYHIVRLIKSKCTDRDRYSHDRYLV
jgi:hypothetical protein